MGYFAHFSRFCIPSKLCIRSEPLPPITHKFISKVDQKRNEITNNRTLGLWVSCPVQLPKPEGSTATERLPRNRRNQIRFMVSDLPVQHIWAAVTQNHHILERTPPSAEGVWMTPAHTSTSTCTFPSFWKKQTWREKRPLTPRRCRSHRLRHPWRPPPCRSCLKRRNENYSFKKWYKTQERRSKLWKLEKTWENSKFQGSVRQNRALCPTHNVIFSWDNLLCFFSTWIFEFQKLQKKKSKPEFVGFFVC